MHIIKFDIVDIIIDIIVNIITDIFVDIIIINLNILTEQH